MSQPDHSATSTDATPPAWLVLDPQGHPYAWYGRNIAKNEAAVWKLLCRTAAIRKKYVADGWTVRPGSWSELFSGRPDLMQASA